MWYLYNDLSNRFMGVLIVLVVLYTNCHSLPPQIGLSPIYVFLVIYSLSEVYHYLLMMDAPESIKLLLSV